MTNPSATPQGAPPLDAAAPSIQQRDRNIALICGALVLIGMPVAWLPGSAGDAIGMTVAILIDLAVMAALILWLVPRERLLSARAGRSALILGIVSVLVGLVFWTGLPFGPGAAAIALGLSQRAADGTGRGTATAGAVLGTIAVVASFVLLLIG
jgi:hypothetical protein